MTCQLRFSDLWLPGGKTALHTISKKKNLKQYLYNPKFLISFKTPCYCFSKGATISERDAFQRKGDGREVKGNECRQQEGKEKVRE